MWLILEKTDVTARAVTFDALIDERSMRSAAGKDDDDTAARFDPRRYDFEIQISDLGGATSVTVDVMGPAGLWSEWQAGLVVNDIVNISAGFYRQVRLTWTGGTPSITGTAAFWATPKYNGLM